MQQMTFYLRYRVETSIINQSKKGFKMSYLNNTYAVFNNDGDKVAVIAINHQQGEKDVSIVVTSS